MKVRPSTPPRPRERGAILVLTLIMVTLLAVIMADAQMSASNEWEAVNNGNAAFQLDAALHGGYQIALAYLVQDLKDDPEIDHLFEEWASEEGIEKILDPTVFGVYLPETPQSGGGDEEESPWPTVRIHIEDEDRKYPLPLLLKGSDALKDRRKESFANLLSSFRDGTSLDVDPGAAQGIADQIIAFLSRPEEDSGFAPTPRPATKSGSLITPQDLALIPALDDTLIYDQVDENGNVARGLMHFVTVWTDLTINVNTAYRPVLVGMMRPEDASIGADIDSERGVRAEAYGRYQDEQTARYGDNWRRDPEAQRDREARNEEPEDEETGYWTDLESIKDDIDTFTDRVLNDVRLYFSVKSRVFSIWVEARLHGVVSRRHWVVRREGARFVQIVSEGVEYPYFRPEPQNR